jgi:hypothetical protein
MFLICMLGKVETLLAVVAHGLRSSELITTKCLLGTKNCPWYLTGLEKQSVILIDALRRCLWTAATIPSWCMFMESHGGMILAAKMEGLGEKTCHSDICPQISHGLTRARTLISAMRDRQLTAWTMKHSVSKFILLWNCLTEVLLF